VKRPRAGQLTIVPTSKALAVATTAALTAWAGSLFGLFALYAFAVGLAVIIAVGLFASLFGGLRSWTIERSMAPLPPTAGDDVTVRIVARPRSIVAPSLALFERTPWGTRRLGIAGRYRAKGDPVAVQWSVPTTSRGVLDAGPGQVFRHDVFGLFRRRVGEVPVTSVVVHPARFLVPAALLLERAGYGTAIPNRSGPGGSDMRAYVPGDDPRRVNWKLSARTLATGSLTVAEAERATAVHRLDVVLELDRLAYEVSDDVDSPGGAERELAVSVAASVYQALALHTASDTPTTALVLARDGHEIRRCTDLRDALDTLAMLESFEHGGADAARRESDPRRSSGRGRRAAGRTADRTAGRTAFSASAERRSGHAPNNVYRDAIVVTGANATSSGRITIRCAAGSIEPVGLTGPVGLSAPATFGGVRPRDHALVVRSEADLLHALRSEARSDHD
jgi:uncharacterized protein (DUF58 family)